MFFHKKSLRTSRSKPENQWTK